MHSKSENIEIMINDESDNVTEELFQSHLSRYPIGLKRLMKGSDFIFDCVHLFYYKCYKTNFKRSRSYLDSPDWMKSKKATINPISKKDNKCFQYAITVALNPEEIGKHPERITKFKSFVNKYNWEEIN